MKWVIIGLGYIARRHIDAIEAMGGELVAACDIDESKKIDGIPFYTDWMELLSSVDCDAVAICTPNDTHGEIAFEAARLGRKVLCEKPLTISSMSAKLLPKEVKAVLQLRYHPILEEIGPIDPLKRYDVDLVVDVKRGKSYWDSWKGDEHRSGGILFNIGIHYLDFLILLFGEKWKVSFSHMKKDAAWGKIEFPNAAVRFMFRITEDQSLRIVEINKKKFDISKADNLSSEDLHIACYREFIKGNGISAKEAVAALELAEDIQHACRPLDS